MKITKKRYLALFLVLLLTLSTVCVPFVQAAPAPDGGALESEEPTPAPTPKPVVKSELLETIEPPACKAAVLMDAESGQVLYEYHAPDAELHSYPASTTKVMTALLTLEAVDRGELNLEQVITASDTFGYDLEAGGSTANIQAGEQMSLLDLLYCLMLPSANEAANILAETVSGSIPEFVALMNERAAELGMEDTNFANAHGLHNASHYTTAYDLALLVRQAIKNDTFVTITSSRTHEVPPTNLTDKTRKLSNTNALVNPLYNGHYSYNKAIGVKTGSTNAAGKCLTSAARQGKDTLVCVVLGAEDVRDEKGNVIDRPQFSESKRLLQWGFDTFQRKELLTMDPVAELPVELSGDTTAVAVKPGEIPETLLPKDMDPAEFQQDITLHYQSLEAPVEAGQVVGELTVRNGDTVYATVPLVAAASAERSQFLGSVRTVQNFFDQTWVKVAIVALVILILVCIVRFTMFKPRKGYRGKTRRQSRNRSRR